MARKLVLLTYNIKPGADLTEYEEYTRSVDYPKFRQNPHILEYSNYVVRENARGTEWFRHFDLMFVDSFDSFHAGGQLHFGDAVILDHAEQWRDRWSRKDEKGYPSDIKITYADEI